MGLMGLREEKVWMRILPAWTDSVTRGKKPSSPDLGLTLRRLGKIDYADGLGIVIEGERVSFAYLKKRLSAISLRQSRTFTLPRHEPTKRQALLQAANAFLAEVQARPDHVTLALPRCQAYIGHLVLPTTARSSLAQVVDYELDRFLPLSKEEVYYDFAVSEQGKEEGRLEVLVFALPRSLVDPYLEDLAQVSLQPQAVTLTSCALVNFLVFCGGGLSRPGVLIALSDGNLELNFVHQGRLIATHLLPCNRFQNQEELMEALSRGLARDLPGFTLADTEVYHWTATNGPAPWVLSEGKDLCLLAKEQLAFQVSSNGKILEEDMLPALGAALQAVHETDLEVNLLPLERRAQQEKRLSLLSLFLAGLVLILGVTWAGSILIRERQILRELSQKSAELAPQVLHVVQQEEEAGRIENQLRILLAERYTQRVSPLLQDLTEVLPLEVYLTRFLYKTGKVDLTGIAQGSASDLVALLEKSPCLRRVAPKAPFTKTPQGETFTLGAEVEPCG